MSWLLVLTQVMPLVINLIGVAEKAWGDEEGSGEAKKEFVAGTVEGAVDVVTAVSTGGQKETWEALAEPISLSIDALCKFLFPHND